MLLRLAPLALCAALAGCGTLKGSFDNRLTTTLDGSRAFATSLYGPLGITAELSAEDAAEIKRMRQAAREAEALLLMMNVTPTPTPKPKGL